MTIQVNARLPDEVVAELDRCASELGLERGALAKRFVTEGLEAWREGRAVFDRPEPLGPGDLAAMRAMLAQGLMEIDRIATAWAAHEGQMRKQERDDQLALTKARAEFVAGIPDRISASLNPIRAEMDAMVERIDNQPRLDAIDGQLKEHTAALKANTAAIERWAKEPRTVFGIVLGDKGVWSTAFVTGWSALMFVLGVMWMVPLADTFPGVGVPISQRLLDDDADFCRLVERRFARTDCQVPKARRLVQDQPGARGSEKQ